MHFALRALLETGVAFALALPVIVAAVLVTRDRRRAVAGVLLVAAVFAMAGVLLRLPALPMFEGARWNWQGKLLELASVFAAVAVIRGLTLRGIGLGAPHPGWVRPTLVAAAVVLALSGVAPLLGASLWLTAEGWWFQATMPGLAEELLFRGVLLAICDRSLGTPWRVGGASVGWGLVITTALFGAVHIADVDRSGALSFQWLNLGPTLLGALLGWLRARTGSVWPCVGVHNIANLALAAFS